MSARSDDHTYDSIPREQIPALLRRNLPAAVCKLKAFVVFQFKPPKKPGGKRAKLPFYVVDGSMRHGEQAGAKDKSRLVSFAEAVRLFEKDRKWGGIGICALPDNPVFFLDLDNCIVNGKPNALAEELLSWGTYTEYSPSGKGLRMVFSGNPQTNRKRHQIGLELFCTTGFVTLTGLAYHPKAHRPVALSPTQRKRLNTLLEAPDRVQDTQEDHEESISIPTPLNPQLKKDIIKALKHTDPDLGYTEWLMVGQALHSTDSQPDGWAFNKWLRWSETGSKFEHTSEKELRAKWRGFHKGAGITISTLFGIAKEHGFDQRKIQAEPLPDDVSPPDDSLAPLSPDEIEDKEVSPLAVDLFDSNGAYMFIGRAKIGKSRALAALVSGAVTGGTALGFKFLNKCKTLIFALEEDPSNIMERLRAYGVEPKEFNTSIGLITEKLVEANRAKYGGDLDWAQWVELMVKAQKPKFVYLDTAVKLRMMWQNDPDYNTKNVTEQDYQNAARLDAIAQKYDCVFVSVIHGSKRKSTQYGFDPFESIGTTSWTLGGCTGALVLMDKPGFNPMEEDSDGQIVLSVRGRYQKKGDEHYLIQSNQNGTFTNLGEYSYIKAQEHAELFMSIISEEMTLGSEYVKADTIARLASKSAGTVKRWLHRAALENARHEDGRMLVSVQGSGYTLISDGHGPMKRAKGEKPRSPGRPKASAAEEEMAPEDTLARARQSRQKVDGEVDPFS